MLVVGGGEQAAQKVRLLRKTSAHITVVAETVTDELRELGEQSAIWIVAARVPRPRPRRPAPRLCRHRRSRCSMPPSRARRKARGIPVNVVDAPALSTFIMPAIVDRAPVTVAIGTEGAAPVLAREIKTLLETLLPANFGTLAKRAQGLRDAVAKTVADAARPPPPVGAAAARSLPPRRPARRGGRGRPHPRRRAPWRGSAGPASQAGRVALIGCGPGDPDLLTLKAVQRLQEADVLVVDRLVNPKVLEYARRDAERIFVGKTPGGPTTSQAEINRILVREAAGRQGRGPAQGRRSLHLRPRRRGDGRAARRPASTSRWCRASRPRMPAPRASACP